MGINIKRHHYLLTTLYIELRQAVSTKYVKHQFLRILFVSLNDKRL